MNAKKDSKTDLGGLIGLSILDDLDVKIDFNELVDKLLSAVSSIDSDTNAVIYNISDKEVNFRCYQASDVLRWIPARQAYCPPKGTALLNKADFAPGPTIQVIAISKDLTLGPFQVLRHHAYVWTGGMFVEVAGLEDLAAKAKVAEVA